MRLLFLSILALLHLGYLVIAGTDTISVVSYEVSDVKQGNDKVLIALTASLNQSTCDTGGTFGFWGMNDQFEVAEVYFAYYKATGEENTSAQYPVYVCSDKNKNGDMYKLSYSIYLPAYYETFAYGYLRIGEISNSWTWENELSFLKGGTPTPPDKIQYSSVFAGMSAFPPPRDTELRIKFRNGTANCAVPDGIGGELIQQ